MSNIRKKGKELSTKRKTKELSTNERNSCQDIGQNSSLFDSFISTRTSKEQTDVSFISSTRNSTTAQETENVVFKFPDKNSERLGEGGVLLETKLLFEKNIFEEETKIEEIGICDNLKLTYDDYKPNESSLFFDTGSFKINSGKFKNMNIEKNIDETEKVERSEDISLDDTVPIPVLPDAKNVSSFQDVDRSLPEELGELSCDTISQCPVCLKTFSSDKYFSHVKSCATKNKLNTQQLLSALRLHKKQLAERKELGLDVQSYRARVSPKRPRNNQRKGPVDSSLQLALALSASLHSALEDEVIQEAEALKEAGLCEEADQKLSTLEKYGFSSEEPLQPRTVKGGLRGRQFPSSLLLRQTQEERERIVTEKVAIILINEEENTTTTSRDEIKPVLKSKDLKEKWDEECQLWNKSRCPEEEKREAFYVKSLSQFVSPSKGDIGDGLRRLSQIPGRNIPMKDNVEDLTPCKRVTDMVANDISNIPTPLRTDVIHRDKKFDSITLSSLSNDFRKLINNDVLSDFKIHCKERRVIPAHKVVFYARCPKICDRITKHPNGQEILDWRDYSISAVLAFIGYIYCGRTDEILMLDIQHFITIKNIADELDCMELKIYLGEARKFSSEPYMSGIKKDLFKTGNPDKIPSIVSPFLNNYNLETETKSSSSEQLLRSKSEKMSLNVSPSSLSSEYLHTDRESPDIFGDSCITDNEIDTEHEKNDLDILVSLIGKPTQTRFKLNEKTHSPPSLLRSEVFSGKRKASMDSSGDEDESLSKKHCSEMSKNECFDSNNIIDEFDLTQSSTSSANDQLCKEDDEIRNLKEQTNAIAGTKNIESEIHFTQCSEHPLGNAAKSGKIERKKSDESSADESFVDLTQNNCDESSLKNILSPPNLNEDLIHPTLYGFNNEDFNCVVSTPKRSDVKCSKANSVTVTTTHCNPQYIQANTSKDYSECQSVSHVRSSHSHQTSLGPLQGNTSCVFENYNGQDFIDPVWEGFDDYYAFPGTNNTCTPSKYNSKLLLNSSSPFASNTKKRTSPKHTYKANKSFTTDDSSFSQSPRMLKESVLSPLKESLENVKLISLDIRPTKVSSENITPSSTSSIKCVSSSSESPKYMSQKRLDSIPGAEFRFQKTDHNSTSRDSDYETVLRRKSSESLNYLKSDITKSRKNLTSQFEVGSVKGPSEISSANLGPDSLKFQSPHSKSYLRKDSLTAMQRLLDDSFEVSDSLFHQALASGGDEMNCERNSSLNQDCMIDGNSGSKLSCSDNENLTAGSCKSKASTDTPSPGILVSDKVTPLPDYSGMKTPALKKELSRFGLKPSLGRRKAKLLLRYIYDQTHPEIPDSISQASKFKQPKGQPPRSPVRSILRKQTDKDDISSSLGNLPTTVKLDDSGSETDEPCSQMSTSSSISSTASLPEESYHEPEDVLTQELSDSSDVRSSIRNLITGNPELHKKVLMYEPIFLEDLMAMLRANGIKSKTNTVMDYLDEQCITFRTNSWRTTNEKRRQKQKSPKKRREHQSSEILRTSPLREQSQGPKKRGRPKKCNN